ncbi:hypothetical protein GCM10010324_53730 [Streptomyces hiroshimensis]|uniref:Uncharacterized protein n=1 Tax=Streptomyces hiroshimensis TaxID=66424 RepID=A0ABQ2YZZ9_9ACTN|nr:hypothetical protein GCM10010324_53730 [Streptomyces hiroshimensis]
MNGARRGEPMSASASTAPTPAIAVAAPATTGRESPAGVRAPPGRSGAAGDAGWSAVEAGLDGPDGPDEPDGTDGPGEPDGPVRPVGSVKLCIGDFAPRSAGCRGFNVAQSAERRQDVKAVQTGSG